MGVELPRAEYRESLPRWGRIRDVLAGEDAIKAAGAKYLPRLLGQSADDYASYSRRALFFGATARTRTALTGLVFRKDLTATVPDVLRPHFSDIDLEDTPLSDFAMHVFDEVLSMGRGAILVDMPDDATPVELRRPYWQFYAAEQVINWRVSRVGSDYITTMVVLKEMVDEPAAHDPFSSQPIERYRVLTLEAPEGQAAPIYQQVVYTRESGRWVAGAPIVPVRRGTPLTFIPIVPMTPRAVRWGIEKPPLEDMALVNLHHYLTTADLRWALHMTGLPTPWVSGAGQAESLPLGPSVVWRLSGPDAKAGMLEFTGKGLSELRAELRDLEEKMGTLGARLIDQPTGEAETAESVKSRNATAHATIRVIASTVSLAMTMAARWHAWWHGVEAPNDEIAIQLNREFVDGALSADEMRSLVLAHQAGAMSFETFWHLLQRGGRGRPGISAEEERTAIEHGESMRRDADSIN